MIKDKKTQKGVFETCYITYPTVKHSVMGKKEKGKDTQTNKQTKI